MEVEVVEAAVVVVVVEVAEVAEVAAAVSSWGGSAPGEPKDCIAASAEAAACRASAAATTNCRGRSPTWQTRHWPTDLWFSKVQTPQFHIDIIY